VIRNFKIKYLLLIGAIFSPQLLALASVKSESLNDSIISTSPKNVEQQLVEKDLIHLHSEGAISTKDAERLINKLSKKANSKSFNESRKNLIPNKEANKNVKIDFIESNSLSKFNIINVNTIIKSEIIKSNSGWNILLQFPEGKEIDISNLAKTKKNYLDFEISKFNEQIFLLKIIDNKKYISKKPIIEKGKLNSINISIFSNKLTKKNNFNFPFLNRFRKRNTVYNNKNEAIPPPLGDIASGSLVLDNRGFIKLNGPNVSLTLNNSSAKDALMRLAKLAGYGFVLANEDSNIQSKSEENINSHFVTLSFIDEDYSMAFNSILLASGLQAKRNENLIIVGRNVLGKSFGAKLSKVYRLNQSSASAAADYLATLGASISKVDTISGTTTGPGGEINNGGTVKFIDTYSSSTGPLIGLTGTTDSRLQTITLVGASELIEIAEKYLKQLDLRQRQVALTVKILDVELTNDDSMYTNSAFRSGSTFLVNEEGKLFSAFGNFIPPALSNGIPGWNSSYSNDSTTGEDGVTTNTSNSTQTINTKVIPNPGFQYNANELYKFLVAQIRSSNTKVLANPTLILSENREKIDGGAETIGDIAAGQATIGRPFANESFVTLGTQVITNYKVERGGEDGGITTCDAEFSTAGLTFGARVNKIDDNGFVTFSLSPELTSVSDQLLIPNCGLINILNIRRLDTGQLRVKDSQTLILTGVISDFDNEIITKTPLLGDIPIIGRLFRSTSGSKRNSELVILVTPKIIDDSYPEETNKPGFDLNFNTEESKKIIKDSR
tara:strand:+ start:369 stop:2714 length:2346 start_codon:yes stop_codon:yes gene_type:complete